MISITSSQLDAWFALFIWPFLRILGLMLSEPLLGHRALPRRIQMNVPAIARTSRPATRHERTMLF